jgi:hypothetical protein
MWWARSNPNIKWGIPTLPITLFNKVQQTMNQFDISMRSLFKLNLLRHCSVWRDKGHDIQYTQVLRQQPTHTPANGSTSQQTLQDAAAGNPWAMQPQCLHSPSNPSSYCNSLSESNRWIHIVTDPGCREDGPTPSSWCSTWVLDKAGQTKMGMVI